MSTDNHLPSDNESLMREFIKKELKEFEVQQEQIKQNKEIAELEAETLRHKHELDHDIAVRGVLRNKLFSVIQHTGGAGCSMPKKQPTWLSTC